MQNEIEKIKGILIEALEAPDKSGTVQGDYICHTDIPKETPEGFDGHLTICGEDENNTYLILIQKV